MVKNPEVMVKHQPGSAAIAIYEPRCGTRRHVCVTGCQGMRIADEEAYYQTVFTENTESVQHITYVNHRQWRDSNKEYKYIHGKRWN